MDKEQILNRYNNYKKWRKTQCRTDDNITLKDLWDLISYLLCNNEEAHKHKYEEWIYIPDWYEQIYEKYNYKTLEPITGYEWCSLWIYKGLKKVNRHNGCETWLYIATPSYWWIDFITSKRCWSNDWKEWIRVHKIELHITEEELEDWFSIQPNQMRNN